jgi:hypothetical protein
VPCTGELALSECYVSAACGRCASFELKDRQDNAQTGVSTITYEVCNRCPNSVSFVSFGVEAPVDAASVPSGVYRSSGGSKWTVQEDDGNQGQLPAFRALTFKAVDSVNGLANGKCEEFSFDVVNWNRDWQENLLLNAGDKYDLFTNVQVGRCANGDAVNTCDNGLAGANCDQCDTAASWYCVPDGDVFALRRVFAGDSVGADWVSANSDQGAYSVDCQCNKICGASQCTVDTSVKKCSDYSCDDCRYAYLINPATNEAELGCDWCAGGASGAGCVPKAFGCPTPIEECATGSVPLAPGFCPNNCSGHGTCNTTTGLCLCFSGVSGLNCGSKNGLKINKAAVIVGGTLAGIVVGSTIAGLLVFGAMTYGGYKAVDYLQSADFENASLHNNPTYENKPGQGHNPLFNPNAVGAGHA